MLKFIKLLALTSIAFLLLIPLVHAPSGNKWTASCRFHLATQDTYIYLSDVLYSDCTYLYNDKINFTNAYMGSGATLSLFTIEVSQADLTLNKLMEGDETKITVTPATETTSTTTLGFPTKPKWAKIDDVERLEGNMWTWSDRLSQATVTISHSTPSIIRFYWTEPPTPPSGPSTPPSEPPAPPSEPIEPVIPPVNVTIPTPVIPPVNVTIPAIPIPLPPVEVPWYVVQSGIVVIMVLVGGAFLYKDVKKRSKLLWPKKRQLTVQWRRGSLDVKWKSKRKKQPKWERRKPLE